MSTKDKCLIVCFLLCLLPRSAAAQETATSVLAGTGPGAGVMRHLDAADGTPLVSATPFGPAFAGGVRVAAADITGDGTADFITGAGFGGGQVVVLDGQDLSVAWTFTPFGASFAGGIYVASGDINGDGRADVIAGGGLGSGQVRAYSGTDHSLIVTRTPFGGSYLGGVTVATGDINGDSRDDFVAGTAIGGTMRVISGIDGATIVTKTPYGALFLGGVNVAAGDVNGDGRTDVITGPGLIQRQVRVFSGHDGSLLASFTPYPTGGLGGVTVAAGKVDIDTRADIVTGPGPGTQPLIKIFSGLDQSVVRSFLGFAPTFLGGVYVATVLEEASAPEFTSDDETTFEAGVPGTFEVTTSGGSPALTVSGTLPSGVTFTDIGDGTGTLEGTPAAGTGGVYPLTFTADDGVNPPVNQAFTLTVNEAPQITTADTTTFAAGVAGSFTVMATGFPIPTLSQTGGTLPAGISFTPASGELAGTATQSGVFPLQFTAANGVSPDAVQNFTLTVSCNTITVDPSSIPNGLYGVAYGPITFTQSGGAGTITWSAMGLPPGLSINSSSGALSGTPTDTVLNASVTITATDSAGCQGSRNVTLSILPATDTEAYNGGVGHTQFAVGVSLLTPNVFVNDNVKNGDNGPGPTNVTFPATSANGTIFEGPTDGTFVYTPNLGFAGPSDSFTYTLTDGNGITNTGAVTINLSQLVWYVTSSGPNGDGRSHAPFNTLAAADAPSGSNQYIFVHTGGATTAGNLAMDANQTLHGQGATFTLNALVIPAGGTPTLTGTVTLANNTAVTAANFAPIGLQALVASGLTQPVVIDEVNVTGGTNALTLTNVDGSVTVTNASFLNSGGAELLINGGTGAVNMNATISSNTGRSVDIQNRTGGTVTLSGPIGDAGNGVVLNNNSGSTITFAGGLALDGSVSTFMATGGGTLNITGSANTIGATTPPTTVALTVANTSIGPSGLTFRSVSAGTAAGSGGNGIILENTGIAAGNGGLTITGTGTPGSGGTIQHKTGADGLTAGGTGIYLNGTKDASFHWMQLNDFDNSAIAGRNVHGFTLENSVVNGVIGTSTGVVEGPIAFGVPNPLGVNGLLGAGLIRNTTIRGGMEHNVAVYNQSGTLNLTIDGTSAPSEGGDPNSPADDTADCIIEENSALFGSDGILIEMQGTSTGTIVVGRCLFRDNRSQAIQVSLLDSADFDVTIDQSIVRRFDQGNEGFVLTNGNNAVLTTMISDNRLSNLTGVAIFTGQAAGNASSSSDLHVTVSANIIDMPPTALNHGILSFLTSTIGQTAGARVRIDGNTVTNGSVSGVARGIVLDTPDFSTTPLVHATVTNNAVAVLDNVTGVGGILVQARQASTIFANVAGNAVTFPNGTPGGIFGLRARRANTATYNLEEGGACTGTAAAVLACLNPASTTEVLGTINVVAAGSTQPPNIP